MNQDMGSYDLLHTIIETNWLVMKMWFTLNIYKYSWFDYKYVQITMIIKYYNDSSWPSIILTKLTVHDSS